MVMVCDGCGGSVTEAFYRVYYEEDSDIECCPNCEEESYSGFKPQTRNGARDGL